MFNKLYSEIKNYIKSNYIFIIIIVTIFVAFRIETGYSIYRPGGIINVNERVQINNETRSIDGSLNMAYVGMIEGRLPFYLIARVLPSWDLVRNETITFNDEETMQDALRRNRLLFQESISTATLLAYQRSDIPFEITSETHYIIYIHENASRDFRIGDEIVRYNGVEFTTLNNLREYINQQSIGDTIEILIRRDNREIVINTPIFKAENLQMIGLATATIFEIESQKSITMDSRATESGPSGGLMLTLAIYSALINEDITRGNRIVGTGTINPDGSIGMVGGIEYKISGAVRSGADIFLVAQRNYDLAREYTDLKDYDIILKGVSSLDEALEFLNNLEAR